MSRIGYKPVEIPKGVDLRLEGRTIHVKGPKGNLSRELHPEMEVKVEEGVLTVDRPSDVARHKALHGLTRSLVANMVEGVTEGFEKKLEIQGVGYRVQKQGNGLVFHLGFSHPVNYDAPAGIELDAPTPTEVVVRGADKQMVGQVAAEIRQIRPPEPYKGKGVRYAGEQVRRKAGKTATA